MEVTRIFDIVSHYAEQYPQQDTVLANKQGGQWRKIGVQEYVETVNNISYGLLKLGISQGDKIGIVSGNRPEWNMIDFAIMQTGAISVPIYPTISQSDYRHILNHAEMKAIFVEGKELRTKLEPIFPEVEQLQHVITFVKHEDTGYQCYDDIVALGKNNPVHIRDDRHAQGCYAFTQQHSPEFQECIHDTSQMEQQSTQFPPALPRIRAHAGVHVSIFGHVCLLCRKPGHHC